MSATVLGVVVTLAVMVLGIVYFLVNRIDRRLESLEKGQAEGFTEIKVAQAAYAQKLDDHLANHPGPKTDLVRP